MVARGFVNGMVYIPSRELALRRLSLERRDRKVFLVEFRYINGMPNAVSGYRVFREDEQGYHCRGLDDVHLARLSGNFFYAPTRKKNPNRKNFRLR